MNIISGELSGDSWFVPPLYGSISVIASKASPPLIAIAGGLPLEG
jgi:hypothetical protein